MSDWGGPRNEDKSKEVTGRTWADVVARLPAGIIGVAAISFVGLLAFSVATKTPIHFGSLTLGGGADDVTGSNRDVLPNDAVVAFALPDPGNPDADPCPTGWSRYTRADGRFIVGVGAHRPGLETLAVFTSDGEREHTLTPDQMPIHNHVLHDPGHTHGLPQNRDSTQPGSFRFHASPGVLEPRESDPAETGITLDEAGGGKAHNNMPPYIALYFCKKEG